MPQSPRPTLNSNVHILLVDDDEVDIMSMQRAFRKLRITNPLSIAHDGLEALDMLRGNAGMTPLSRPCLIILDLNMPRMNGIEFLEVLRADPHLQHAIVLVLTTSHAPEDRQAACRFNIAGYLTKSDVTHGHLQSLNMLNHYLSHIEFP